MFKYKKKCFHFIDFKNTGLEINSIHKSTNKSITVNEAEGFFIGGGNTFLLLNTLYDLNLLEPIKKRVLVSFVSIIL
jgi:dipeptidase E